jgi:Flp pilus assembly protein CpaB
VRKRSLVIGLVATVAVVTAVILISQGSAGDDGVVDAVDHTGAKVLASTRDIQAGQALDPLIEEDVFKQIVVPDDALTVGPVTDIDQLRGSTALVAIPRNHQISARYVEQLDEPTP